MLPAVRMGSATFAGLAFGGLLIGALGGGAEWLAAAGGLGAVALGAQQVAASIRDTEAKRRKVGSLARLIRRSLVEACHLEERSTSLATWLSQVGNARSLDTLQNLFRELQGLAAELGDADADAADRAFEKFRRSADVLNPLYAERQALPPDYQTLGERGQILERLIGAVDALGGIAPPVGDEPSLSIEFREKVARLALSSGNDEDANTGN